VTLVASERLDVTDEQAQPVLLGRGITGGSAWRRDDIAPGEWIVPITADAMAELNTIAGAFAEFDGSVEELAPDAFDWPATTEIMVEIQSRLNNGIGFAVLDGLPTERWGERASRAVSWLLTNMLAPAIKQKLKGARVYDVRDTGAKLKYGVRRSITNLSQEFHTDGSFLAGSPNYLTLACLHQAEAGGVSRVASLTTAHNILMDTAPQHLARLYRPFWWDRQAEHPEGDRPANWLPVFESDGETLSVRYYDDYIRNGYKLMDAEMDEETSSALEAMQAIIEMPENRLEFRLQPGQILYGHNQLVAHGRTEFRDPGNDDSRRHLLLFWLRNAGGTELEAGPALIA
jgi:hypothetical protein